MTDSSLDSASFEALSRELLSKGITVRFQARGASMSPSIRDGQIVHVTPVIMRKLRKGDIVLTKDDKRFLIHRLVIAEPDKKFFVTRGDCGAENDPPVRSEQILGLVIAKEFKFGKFIVRTKLTGFNSRLTDVLARVCSRSGWLARTAGSRRSSSKNVERDSHSNRNLLLLAVLSCLAAAPSYSRAQVVADNADASGNSGELIGPGTQTINFTQRIPNGGVNRLLIVGVSLNITSDTTAAVTGVTFNGTALSLVGAHNDAGNTRRSEIWSLLAPVTGGAKPVVVSVNVPGTQTVGVVAGAVSFTGVDQTVPLGPFYSADGAAGGNSQLDVPSVVNGMVIDTLAIGGPENVTVPGPQVSQWNFSSTNVFGRTNDPPDVTGSGSTRAGAPSVPISESFSANSNWSLGAVSINPTAADVGVTTSLASAVFLGSSTTFTIAVTNNGPSAANTVSLKDTLAAGMTFNSSTSTVGGCTQVNPTVCTLGNMVSGATATITVVATAATAGSYSNTAVVSDSGTPPDPNSGNNTYVAVATVQSPACGTVSQATTGTGLTGVLNTYYSGKNSVAAGATSIQIGAATGGPGGTPAAIAAGNLLLVIQMQDAAINDTNSVLYGNGSTGQGFTSLNSAGDYEFVTATNAVGTAGGTVNISGAGSGGGLVSGYNSAAASNNAGQSTFQVIVVPQYTTASFNATTPPSALAWNGATGGVLALDASGVLTLNSAVVSVDGAGFRGGAGLQLSGNAGGSTADYLHAAPAAYPGGGPPINGVDAPKGEGIAGTPLWIELGGTYSKTTSKYPSGSGADGSSGRGAPGNAGGGGTDGDPTGNDQNAGGGGGANGGAGGFGGDSWSSNLSVGGEGGASFPANINRVAMGGGGGGGTRNNSDGDTLASGGAAGGGIIIIRAYGLSGTATLTANGVAAYNATSNDAGGGGGAGGSIVVLSATGGEGGLTLQANGGRGGNAWQTQPYSIGNRHGPGGGGGGGVVLVSGAPASIGVAGGSSGLTLNPGVSYGATAGGSGTSVTNASISQTSGTLSGAQCTPDMTVVKSLVGGLTRGSTATYTLTASNVSSYGPSSGSVTLNDTLPVGLTPISASGTGWSCSVASQTVSCVDGTPLPAGSSYSPITVTANVSQSAPATITNTGVVGGGGEVNLINDTSTNTSNVGSTADLSVSDAASPNPVAAGANIIYAQVVTNNGPSAADNATIVEAVPPNTTFVSINAPAGWNCVTPASGGTGSVVCTDLNMAASTAATFSLVVKVGSGVANGTVIANSVTASSSVTDPNSNNNTASASVLVGTTAQAEMTVTNSNAPDPVIAGNNITYTQTATNVGTATANNPTFSENTPLHTTFVSMVSPPGTTCTTPPVGGTGAINCTAASSPAGSSGTVTLVLQVVPGTPSGTQISDTVTVNSSNQAFGANSATAIDYVATAGQADLALATGVTPVTVIAGNNITYTQTVSNNGPAAASSVTFTQNIPAGTTFSSISAPAGWTCTTTGPVNCTDPSVAVGYSADIIVTFAVPATDTTSPISATSSVTSSVTTDPNPANNSNTTNTPLVDKCNLTVTNVGAPSPITAGATITYTQTVSNSGPSNCTTGTFTEATPLNTTFVSVSAVTTGGGTWTCPNSAPISCTNPNVPPGSVATITAKYTVNAGTAAGTIITDTATASSATQDTNPADNTATSTIGVAGAGQADLSVTNSGSPNPVKAGQNISYAQTVVNNGPAAAANVTLTENLPANTTFVSLIGPGGGWSCTSTPPYTCSIASLAAGVPATFTFAVQVTATVAGGTAINDTASVASSVTTDPNLGNNSASTTVFVAGSADLSVTNSANPVPVQAGNNISYTQTVANAGPSVASGAQFSENTPTNTTFQSITIPAGWFCTTPPVGSAGAINCTNPSVAVGSAAFTVVVKVTAGTPAGTAINDTATVNSSTSDPNPANNTAVARDMVALATQADLVVTNSAAPASVAAGSNVTYTQSVTNLGPAAAATGATFTQSTPPNTNFQSVLAPAGWSCAAPAVGAAGTITCTDSNPIAVNAAASNFSLVLQVNASTPSGTNIAETATATVSNIVPGLTTNSATANVLVANANSADMAIVRTAMPNGSVAEGDPLTYTLQISNNGPATATNVVVTDPLPSLVTWLSSTSTQGNCSEAGGTVTCLLGTMNNGGTATVTIVTLAAAPGSATNTATVSADQTDPNLANNTSSQTEIITMPTKITLQSFSAQLNRDKSGRARAVLTWKTAAESHNLGFNLYRDENGGKVRLNPSLIAGSALMMAGALPKHAGRTYTWIDFSPTSALYWLEDVDVDGARILHGPITALASTSQLAAESEVATSESSPTLSQLNQTPSGAASPNFSHERENTLREFVPTASQQQKQLELAAHPAVKLYVKHEGWHRITQPELLQAGLDPNVDPALLHLYAEAIELPIQITGATAGPGGFGPQATIEFYGTGIDTPYSGTRVYWLAAENGPGQRMPQLPLTTGSNQPPASFRSTVEVVQHTTYFAALITTDGNNFFGPFISPTATDQVITTRHLDASSNDAARIEVILQGVILGFPHDVAVALNGVAIGNANFTGQAKGTFVLDLPPNTLVDGDNTVTLTAQNGEYDTSLLQSVRITYPHTYTAEADRLKFTGMAGEELRVNGFAAAPAVVLDVTDPNHPIQVTPLITVNNANPPQYALQMQVPWSAGNTGTRHTLLAVAPDGVLSAAAIRANHPSHWHRAQQGSEIVMVSHGELANALTPLVEAHRTLGQSTSVVLIDELYDEFTFGERHPAAIRAFLQSATKVWQTKPHYLLLNGRASFDPRNYLGLGHLDLVPTKIVASSLLMTASDDWFSDFNNTGIPAIATGRFPVGTAADATLVANKVATYLGQSSNGPWTSQALMVADINDGENFEKDAQMVQSQLPKSMQVTDVFATTSTIAQDQQQIINSINAGQLLVDYSGHGSEDQWSGDNLFDGTLATALTNGSSLPVFLTMDCLNGFFQDVYSEPLGVTLLLAPNGGAVAVLASSGLNQPAPQTIMNKLIVQNALHAPYPALGDAIIQAKSAITDLSVRRTFNLLGDPAMQIKQPGIGPAVTGSGK